MLDSTDQSIPSDMHYPKQCSVAGEGKPIKDPIFDDDGVISCHERSRFHHLTLESSFSDVRLKNNIEYFDTLPNGITLYKLNWNETSKTSGADIQPLYGVIAQEIEKTYPKAFYEGPDGYLRVGYDIIFQTVVC